MLLSVIPDPLLLPQVPRDTMFLACPALLAAIWGKRRNAQYAFHLPDLEFTNDRLCPLERSLTYESDRAAVSRRFKEIQDLNEQTKGKTDNMAFANLLNEAATELGFAADWTANKVSKVRGATLGIDVTDMTVVARVDPKQRGYTYVAFGIPVKKGEDAWAVLARMAKKGKSA